jgi:predicted nucleotidyltransferase
VVRLSYDGVVSDAESLAAAILPSFGDATELRLIGGLAVLAHVGSLARRSVDVDVVAMTPSSGDAFIEHLERLGFQAGETGGWRRAVRMVPGREVVDIASHPIVQPRTFETLTLRAAPKETTIGGARIMAVGLDDLILMKLLAGRDQDIVDLMLLVSGSTPSIAAIVRSVESDDLERSVASTAVQIRHVLAHDLDEMAGELLGRPPSQSERAALADFTDALAKEGL